jgi:hypothetical protein
MATISKKQREIIKGYLEGFIQGIVDEYKGRIIHRSTIGLEYLSRSSINGELKPFQAALIPTELIRINQFERGLSTIAILNGLRTVSPLGTPFSTLSNSKIN